jgi:hypothetical protein
VAKLIQFFGTVDAATMLESGKRGAFAPATIRPTENDALIDTLTVR